VTLRLRAPIKSILHNAEMDRKTYIAPIVEAYIPDATNAEKLALTADFWALFDTLYATFEATERFDSQPPEMVESKFGDGANPAPNL
jgi:predicted phage-related endonuclease